MGKAVAPGDVVGNWQWMTDSTAAGDVVQQTCKTMESISQGLCDAGADWYDLVTLKVGSTYQGSAPASRRLLHPMLETI